MTQYRPKALGIWRKTFISWRATNVLLLSTGTTPQITTLPLLPLPPQSCRQAKPLQSAPGPPATRKFNVRKNHLEAEEVSRISNFHVWIVWRCCCKSCIADVFRRRFSLASAGTNPVRYVQGQMASSKMAGGIEHGKFLSFPAKNIFMVNTRDRICDFSVRCIIYKTFILYT